MATSKSTMTKTEVRRCEELLARHAAGERTGVIEELHNLVEAVSGPIDKAGLLYHEVTWLLELGDVPSARTRFEEMKNNLFESGIGKLPPDNGRSDLDASLGLMALFAEGSVLIAEGDKTEALLVLQNLVSRYKRQLSLKKFSQIRGEILTCFGMLLADENRWLEAGPLLEQASPPRSLQPVLSYHLGQYYYTIRDYKKAAKELKDSFTDSMPQNWRCRAHFIRGVCEYHLDHFETAKREFEQSAQSADADYIRKYNIWGWLEVVCRALGTNTEAEKYHARAIQTVN
jgi:tetratricopeptide (TPR) repeat protein